VGTVVLVLCGWPGCQDREIRPLLGQNYSFLRKPGTKAKYTPVCESCRARAHEQKKETLVAHHS
jgi:hypothetical protein